jgi:maltooligosyltrehalose synthase
VVVAPRLSYRLTRGEHAWPLGAAWGEQRIPLPAGRWQDALTGAVHDVGDEPLRMAELLELLPVALLVEP